MIRSLGIILIAILSVCAHFSLTAQEYIPTPVEISSEKVTSNGKTFLVHHVIKGQTLFSISKAYNVPMEKINECNPSLKEGLKSGSIIYIPIQSYTPPVPPQPKDKKYRKYTVKWYENIYDVADKHMVPVDALIAINNLGENTVLSKRQTLIIPDKEYITEYTRYKKGADMHTPKVMAMATEPQKGDVPADTTVTKVSINDSIPEVENIDYSEYLKETGRTYKVTLLLPFNTASGVENANTNQMDLYAGALLAFNDFTKGNPDRDYKLNVVDLNDYPTIFSVIVSGILDDSELIIGPIYEKDLSPLARWADQKRIPLVSPLDPKAAHLAADHPFFFQYPPTQESLLESTFDGIIKESNSLGLKPIVIYEKWTSKSNMVTGAISSLMGKGAEIDTLCYGILEGRGIDTVMIKMMDTTKVNPVLVVSESEAFVSDVLRNLLLVEGAKPDLEISLYGYPKWRGFEIIELSYFHDLDTHMSLQYYIDYNRKETAAFVSDFTYHFKTDPSQYAFQGYDIMSYFLSVLDMYGRSFPAHIHNHEKSLLQSCVRFEKASSGSGFTNKGIQKILYSGNWEIKSWE